MRPTFSALFGAAFASIVVAPGMSAQQSSAAQARTLTLQTAIQIAQRDGPRARAARYTLESARSNFHAYTARQLPQVFLSGDVPSYNRSIIPAPQPDGSLEFRSQELTQSSASLFVSQNLPWTGGSLFVSSQLAQLKRTGSPETWSSTPFSVNLTQPILRSNSLKWTSKDQSLSAELAERTYDESMEDVASATAIAFINLYGANIRLQDATVNLQRNERLRERVKTRFRLGGVSAGDVGQAELGYLQAQQALSQASLARDEADMILHATLGLPAGTIYEVVLPGEPPVINADTATAIAAALRNRSDIMVSELQDLRARRLESQARFDGGIGATITASYGYNATAGAIGDVYSDLLDQQRFRFNVTVPVWQWGAVRADRAAARSARSAATASAQESRDQIRRDASFAIRRLDQARRTLTIAIQADTLASASARDALVRYDFGSIPIEILFGTLNTKDQAAQSRITALTGLWTEFYRLRRVTMFDFETARAIR